MLEEKVEQGEEAWDFKEGSQVGPTEKVILSKDLKDVMREPRGHLWKECSRRRVPGRGYSLAEAGFGEAWAVQAQQRDSSH